MTAKRQLIDKMEMLASGGKTGRKVQLFLTDWLQPQAYYYKSCYVPEDVFKGQDQLFSNWKGGFDMIITMHSGGKFFIETPPPTVPDKIRMYPTGSEPPEPERLEKQ